MNATSQQLLLYVEDNQDHAEIVLESFSRYEGSTRVVHVEDGEAALAYLRRSGSAEDPRPRLILLDLRLPKIDGFEVLRTVRSTPGLSDIPVVVLTTSASDADVARAYEHHVNSYLVKPDDYPKLDRLIKELGNYWLVNNAVSVGGH
jgi:CheY-like chemotaxis protein